MTNYQIRTIELATKNMDDIASKFREEVKRLVKIGAVDPDDHARNVVFGIALENMADEYLRNARKTTTYKNLKRF
jgi:hypothetical protein